VRCLTLHIRLSIKELKLERITKLKITQIHGDNDGPQQ
jgi:hypothetical protein